MIEQRTPHKANSHKKGNFYRAGMCAICLQQRPKSTVHHIYPSGFRKKQGVRIKVCFDCHATLHALFPRERIARMTSKKAIREALRPYLAWARNRPSNKRDYRSFEWFFFADLKRGRRPGRIGVRHLVDLGEQVDPEVISATTGEHGPEVMLALLTQPS